jgi:hypothetical protein
LPSINGYPIAGSILRIEPKRLDIVQKQEAKQIPKQQASNFK